MATRAQLKAFFETGDYPTQGQFATLIDSFFIKNANDISIADITGLVAALAGKGSAATVQAAYDKAVAAITSVEAILDGATPEGDTLRKIYDIVINTLSLTAGGTTGQVLAKASNADGDTEWVDIEFADISGQPTDNAALGAALDLKVDKAAGYDLSQENYTTAEKNKLATLSEHFKGKYATLAALIAANPSSALGDYATVDAGAGSDTKLYMWDGDDNTWVLSSDSITPDATEISSGLIELATIAEALARTDDQRAMTALKTIALILDEKKNVDRQIAPVGVNEVSFLMKNAGNVSSLIIAGASNAKLKIGLAGIYPTGAQTFPFAYAAGDRVFATYNYTDLTNASCNIILTCRDN